MKTCDQCGSTRLLAASAKCSDLCHVAEVNEPHRDLDGYVPRDCGIGGGDYVEFTWCLQCGKIQGSFPMNEDPFED